MTLASLNPIADHLWQSTVFAIAVFALTLLLRRNSAQVRYVLWLTASVKFLIPFSLLVSLGSRLEWQPSTELVAPVSTAIVRVSQPFATLAPEPPPSSAFIVDFPWVEVVAALWILGFLAVAGNWFLRWRGIRAVMRGATPVPVSSQVPVLASASSFEPGVFGLFQPVIVLPRGILPRLSTQQFHAILAHELCHVQRRDNLAAAIHMLVEALVWFHPLVWWIGARLIEEREKACDQEVLRQGSQPETYAEGILHVCKYSLQSPLPCAAGVSGADLRSRIEAIMLNGRHLGLGFRQKAILGTAALVAVTAPLFLGLAQNTKPLVWEVAVIKPTDPDNPGNPRIRVLEGGSVEIGNRSLKEIAAFAFDIEEFQVVGGPGWTGSDKWNIRARPPVGEETDMEQINDRTRPLFHAQLRERLRNLLIERFQLAFHWDSKPAAVYALVTGRNGPRLKATDTPGNNRMGGAPGRLGAKGGTMEGLARSLSKMTGRPVEDRTGLKGNYDFELTWSPDPGPLPPPGEKPQEAYATDPSGPSLFTALQEQLGLKLEPARGSVKLLVLDKVERPSAN